MNAYSEDLRKKVVEAVIERQMPKTEVAGLFEVSLSSVKRYVGMAREGRCLAPKKHPGSKPKLDERARKLLAADIQERPFARLSERRKYLQKVAGVSVSRSTVYREIGRMKHTRKRGRESQRAQRVPESRLEGYSGRRDRCQKARLRRRVRYAYLPGSHLRVGTDG